MVQLTGMGESVTIQHVFELVLRLKQICNFDPATGASCKMERLEADMEEIAASGQKAIVFSQWVETLETLRESLKRFGPLEYHGRIPSAKRDGVIQQFKTDSSKHVILMSYGAGSGIESAILPLRILVRSMVESSRGRSSHQSRAPHRRIRARNRDAHDGFGHD